MPAPVIGFLLYLCVALMPTGSAGELAVRFAGSDDAVTPSFEAEAGAEVHWRAESGVDFRILLKGAPEDIPIIVADPPMWKNRIESPEGTMPIVRSGTYHFEVRASGPWQIEVLDSRPR